MHIIRIYDTHIYTHAYLRGRIHLLSATSPPQQTKMSRQLEDEQMARVGAGEGSGSGKEGGAGVVHRKWATITCSRVH